MSEATAQNPPVAQDTPLDDRRLIVDPGNEVGLRISTQRSGNPISARHPHREMTTLDGPGGRKVKVPGRLSRQGIIQVIQAGGSVNLPMVDELGAPGFRSVMKVEDVPSEAQLAESFGESFRADDIRAQNEQTIEKLRRENQQLENLKNRNNPARTGSKKDDDKDKK